MGDPRIHPRQSVFRAHVLKPPHHTDSPSLSFQQLYRETLVSSTEYYTWPSLLTLLVHYGKSNSLLDLTHLLVLEVSVSPTPSIGHPILTLLETPPPAPCSPLIYIPLIYT